MQIKWQNRAITDLEQLQEYIAQDNPIAAGQVAKRIIQAVDLLKNHPGIGRPGRVPNTRELVIKDTPYLLPYRLRKGVIEILRVLHGAMQWPETF